MSADPAHRPALRLVDPNSGELYEAPSSAKEAAMEIRRLKDIIAGLERDVRGWAIRYAELKRDRYRDARNDPLWALAVTAFHYWRVECKHPRSRWSIERFDECQPYLRRHGLKMELRAIAGAAFDPFTTIRKNGTKKAHNGWELIHKSPGRWEEFCNCAPKGWKPPEPPSKEELPEDLQTQLEIKDVV